MRAGRSTCGLLGLACLSLALASAPTASRAGETADETLRTLYRIAISAEICGFPIAHRQADALGKAMNRALSESGLDADAADQLYRDVDSGLASEGWETVCEANGTWARTYRSLLAANTK